MITHIGYDVCVESQDVLCIVTPETLAQPAGAALLQELRANNAVCEVPAAANAQCRAYLLLQQPPRYNAPAPRLSLVESCLSPAALQRRLQYPNLYTGKDLE